MNQSERLTLVLLLSTIAILVAVDLVTDSNAGAALWHLGVEAALGVAALFGIFFILKGSFKLKKKLDQEIQNFSEFRRASEIFKSNSKKYTEGLSLAIDHQLTNWKLTAAEKEVAFLLLKGMSLKEVADVRSTSEKTARAQSMAIYSKAGLTGRSQLSAFFLEDLLPPNPLN